MEAYLKDGPVAPSSGEHVCLRVHRDPQQVSVRFTETTLMFGRAEHIFWQIGSHDRAGLRHRDAEQAARHESPGAAVHALALSPAGALYAEPEFLVREELRDPGVYFAILHSLAAGKTRPNEIAQDAGIARASVGKYLDVLRRLRLVRRETPLTETRPERSRKGLYLLADPFLRFWFRYVYPNRSALESGRSREVLEAVVLPDLDTFMGQPCEDICRQHLIADGSRLLGWQPLRVGRYWDSRTEIGLVAVDAAGEHSAFVECKWGRTVDVPRVVRRLREKARAVAPLAAASHRYLVISRTDVDDEHHVRRRDALRDGRCGLRRALSR